MKGRNNGIDKPVIHEPPKHMDINEVSGNQQAKIRTLQVIWCMIQTIHIVIITFLPQNCRRLVNQLLIPLQYFHNFNKPTGPTFFFKKNNNEKNYFNQKIQQIQNNIFNLLVQT